MVDLTLYALLVAPTFLAMRAWYGFAAGGPSKEKRPGVVAALLLVGSASALALLAEAYHEQSILGPYYSARRIISVILNLGLAAGVWGGSRLAKEPLAVRIRVLAAFLLLPWLYTLIVTIRW